MQGALLLLQCTAVGFSPVPCCVKRLLNFPATCKCSDAIGAVIQGRVPSAQGGTLNPSRHP